jgi:rfaE bifunctional protein kinase chain/domain
MTKETAALHDLIDRFKGRKVAVWGDFILDEYIYGCTRRISREAPVLILSYRRREYLLGGAGNALQNLKALGATPIPVGIIGRDEAGEALLSLLKTQGIRGSSLFRESRCATPIKTRILAGEDNTRKQQILRIDREAYVPDDANLKLRLAAALRGLASSCSALIISDYSYQSVRPDVFKAALPSYRKARVPVCLDSRFRLMEYPGVTIATPNEPEVEAALGRAVGDTPASLRKAGDTLRTGLRSRALLITRGSKGMALFEKGKPVFSLPVHGSTDIVDVTGAGDTVISVFALALAAGGSFRQAALLANVAGGLVVMKKGTATVTPAELRGALDR